MKLYINNLLIIFIINHMNENKSYTKIKISNEKHFGFLFSIVFFLISIYPIINDKKINLIFLTISIIIFLFHYIDQNYFIILILFGLNLVYF